jgi:phosphomannomutase
MLQFLLISARVLSMDNCPALTRRTMTIVKTMPEVSNMNKATAGTGETSNRRDRLHAIFKAYDIRGLCPEQLDDELARAIGAAFAIFSKSEAIVVARDMRPSGVSLVDAFSAGVTGEGVRVIDIGLASTDLLYFASGALNMPGATFTASHNPAQYNGIKMCLAGASPLAEDTGLRDIRDAAVEFAEGTKAYGTQSAAREERSMLDAFAKHALSFIDVEKIRPLKVVADTANGMGGLVAPAILGHLPLDLDILFGELDGTFPNHPADPIQPENLRDLQARLLSTHADVGLAFDGDADRVFLVDEKGQTMSGSLTTSMVAAAILAKHPGGTVLYNLICSKAVPAVITESGGVPIRARVGHSFIKAQMAETGAIFGGEHSGHYYFKDNYRADSGIIAALFVLQMLSEAGPDAKLSELRKPFERFVASGEINTKVVSPLAVIERVEAAYGAKAKTVDHLDGLTIDMGSWWFNLRPSNTEPYLRLNLEASTGDECSTRTAEVVSMLASLAKLKQ